MKQGETSAKHTLYRTTEDIPSMGAGFKSNLKNWTIKTIYPHKDSLDPRKEVKKALYIIDYLKPKHWFIENPATGRLKDRGLLDDVPMKRCCYCKYDTDGTFLTKKETAIWGSVENWTPRM